MWLTHECDSHTHALVTPFCLPSFTRWPKLVIMSAEDCWHDKTTSGDRVLERMWEFVSCSPEEKSTLLLKIKFCKWKVEYCFVNVKMDHSNWINILQFINCRDFGMDTGKKNCKVDQFSFKRCSWKGNQVLSFNHWKKIPNKLIY